MLDAFHPIVAFLSAPALSWGPLFASRAEVLGATLGVWMVVCNMRVDPTAWPLAIVSSAMYLLVFWDARLYGDALLQIVFITVAGWGWWQWLHGRQRDGSALKVRWLTPRGRIGAVAAFFVLWPAIGTLLATTTDTDVPWWDAFPTAGSLVGQWLLARKYVDTWTAWVIVNIVAVLLFAHKALWLTVGLYTLFAAMAVAGWLAWRRIAVAPSVR